MPTNEQFAVGTIYKGKVTRIMTFGAFVAIAPKTEGLVHISKLDSRRVEHVEDAVSVGDELVVKITEVDQQGRINLSRKDAMDDIAQSPSLVVLDCFAADAEKHHVCSKCGYEHYGDAPPNFCPQCGSSNSFRKKNEVVEEGLLERNEETSPPVEPNQFIQAEPATSAWNGWREKETSHDLAITAISSLRDYSAAYLSELVSLRNKWGAAKKESQEIFESVMQNIRTTLQDNKKSYESSYASSIKESDEEENRIKAISNACNNFLNEIPANLSAARSKVGESMQPISNHFNYIAQMKKQERNALAAKRDTLIAEAEREANSKADKAREEQIARDTQADREYQEKKEVAKKKRRADIAAGMNQKDVKSYTQLAMSSRFNAEKYDCPVDIPDYLMLGKLNIALASEGTDHIDVVQAVETQVSEFTVKTRDELIFGLPYCQKLDDGISLLVRYAPQDRITVQGLLHPLLLELFMLFPAGKLEATMIDPLELGASFADIPKLAEAPNASRIIDTKIWSKEKDIENAVATLRQRLENMTQSYGGDKESRLKKEVVRVLAVTDFPTGFTETALKDLRAIVRNSASLGVCVMIWANDFELEKLKERSGSLVEEITQGLLDTKASGSRLMLQKKEYHSLFLTLDDMSDALANKDKIMITIRDSIDRMQVKVEHFAHMFREDIEDSNNWFMGNHSEISVPIGIRGANTVVRMVLGRSGGSTEHHVLIAGQTGAGKSTLLHTMIMSTMINYSPDEVQMYLVDFKEGVEFKPYTRYRLPSLRVVAIDSEREFGLNILKELCVELETRADLFSRNGVEDINDYVNLPDTDIKVPKLLLIFDEVQELFRSDMESDDVSKECLSCLNKLVMQGRAMGIHIILACQDFNHCSGLEALFSQMAVRIAVKGSEVSAASILSSDNPGIRTLQNQPAGSAIYNGGGGVEPSNIFFQVSYMDKQERTDMLSRFDAYYTDSVIAEQYQALNTRILLTNAEDDVYNCFNTFIIEGIDNLKPLATTKDSYGLLLGQGFGKKNVFVTELSPTERNNLLVVGKDERCAQSIFVFTAMSVLYEELHSTNDKSNALVYIMDLSAEELPEDLCDFRYLEQQFPDQIKVAGIGDVDKLIATLYQTLLNRVENPQPNEERVFVLLFGINRARSLRIGKIYEEDNGDELTTLEMIQKLFERGSKHHINFAVWGESLRSIENILGNRYDAMFDKRIAYGLDDDDMELLVSESHSKSLRGSTAVYMDIGREVKNTHFRPYNLPAKVWIERYGQAYEEMVSKS